MNFIIAILLATTLTFAYLFLKERKKIAHKNYEIDELHKIMDEMKYEQYKKLDNNQELNQKNINYDQIAQLVGLTQHQRNKRLAAMQNAASRGNGSGYGLNNALGMLGIGSRL